MTSEENFVQADQEQTFSNNNANIDYKGNEL
jgi:hypothetical protein